VSGLGWPTLGTTGIPLVGGTGDRGMRLNATTLLWWKMIEYYKAHGFRWLDTGGVSESRNPGGYFFKTQLLGKRFVRPDRYIGLFDAWENPLSGLLFKAVSGIKEAAVAAGRWRARKRQRRAPRPAPSASSD
jgi:lipid II:glycine glycyltransferase (peptidoglycan interpeptide bridge formation enzyme)